MNSQVLPIFESWNLGNVVFMTLVLIFFSIGIVLIGCVLLIVFKRILRLPLSNILKGEDIITSILLGLVILLLYSYFINQIILPRTVHKLTFTLFVLFSLIFLLKANSRQNLRVCIDVPLRKFILLFMISYFVIMTIYFYHTLSNFILPYWDGLFNHGKGAVIAVSGFYINDPSLFYWLLAELYQLTQHATTNVYVLSGALHWIPLAILLLSLVDLAKGKTSSVVVGFLTGLTGTYITYYGLIHGVIPDFNNMSSYVRKMLESFGPFTSGVLFPSYSSPRTICGVSGLLAVIYSFILFLRGKSLHDITRSTLLFSSATVLLMLGYPPYLIPVAISFLLFSLLVPFSYLRRSTLEVSKRIFVLNEVQASVIFLSLIITGLRTGVYQTILFWTVIFLPPILPLLVYHTSLVTRRVRKSNISCSIDVIKATKVVTSIFFLLAVIVFTTSIIFILTPHTSFPWQVHRWSTYTFVSPKYDWYVYLAAYAPILIPSFLICLMIFLRTHCLRTNEISLLELIFTSSLVICFLLASIVISNVFGLYYSDRTITEWVLSSLVYFLAILMTIVSKTLRKTRVFTILLLILISLSIPGTVYYSHFIATYNPLFNKLKSDDIILLEQLRQLYSNGKISLVLPLSEDLEYLSNYLAAVPTYTVATREFIVKQITQEQNFLNVIKLLEKYQIDTLLVWKNDKLLALFQKQCHSNCTILTSSNLAIILIQIIPEKPRENRLFVVEHSELWAIKIPRT